MKQPRINLITRCTSCGIHFTIGESGDDHKCDACIEDTKSFEGEYYDSERQQMLEDLKDKYGDMCRD